MDNKDINPKEKLKDYEIEIEGNRNLFQKIFNSFISNINLLPADEDKNLKLTNRSITYLWNIGIAKAHVIKFLDSIHMMLFNKSDKKADQNNIEVEIIKKNNVIERISTAKKKLDIISPIIPETKNFNR